MAFDESKHPRDSDGKFTDGSSGDSALDDMSAEDMSKALQQEASDDKLLTKSQKPVKIIMLSKDLYAEFDSVIRTRYGNKTPKKGHIMLYNPIKGYNYYLEFNHDERNDRNVCVRKLNLDLDRAEIERIINGGKKK